MSVSNQLDISALTEMGFSRERVETAMQATNNRGIPEALEWLFSHPVDDGTGQKLGGGNSAEESKSSAGEGPSAEQNTTMATPSETTTLEASSEGNTNQGATALSLKCEDCGKLLKSEAEATMHASRSGHTNFAESTEEIKPLTDEEKAEQKKRLQQKLEERRLQRLQDEKEQAKLREKTRRKTGQEMTKAKDEMALNEMKKLAEERRREKMEEKRLKQQLREQIAKDRANFKAKNQPQSKASEPLPSAQTSSTSASAAPAVRKEHDSCRIQFRLPDGSTQNHTFKADDTLFMVRNYVAEQRPDLLNVQFTLSTTFPRKVFADPDASKTLKELRLVPSTVLVLAKKV